MTPNPRHLGKLASSTLVLFKEQQRKRGEKKEKKHGTDLSAKVCHGYASPVSNLNSIDGRFKRYFHVLYLFFF